MAAKRTDRPFSEELPILLRERGMSLRGLARQAGVTDAHLSRIVRRADYKSVSPDLARRVAQALGLPEDYFPEYREGVVIERVKDDPRYRDRLYDGLRRGARR